MDDLLCEFLTETSENLSLLDIQLVKLEQNPNDPELLDNIFRLVHTIKGTCGFLGLPRLEAVAHAGENVLGKFRDGELDVTPQAVTLILSSLDTIKRIISTLEATEEEPAGDDATLIAALNAMASGDAADAPAEEDVDPAADDAAAIDDPATDDAAPIAELEAAPEPADADAMPDFNTVDEPPVAEADPEPVDLREPVSLGQPLATTAPPPALAGAGDPFEQTEPKESAVANQSIRVSVDLLENLMTMVSELVLTRNQLLQILRSQKDSDFDAPLQRLNHVTSELQEGVMKTRMQPIGNAWAKLPRLIRDLSHELGKKIDLQMVGAETELDRQVLELIKDPLTHMVRNSADHGIEPINERSAAGKPETGRIRLNAFHVGGHINIEISDDGRGLAIDKIKAKAIANDVATEAELAGMSDQQIQQFIFKAGFSTAAQVTSVSGRGVGLDVVRTNVERIGGTIELKSTEGRGSTFIIKIPLTLAIVSALVVESSGERFAIPQISVVELVKAGGHSEHAVELVNGAPVLRLRSRLLPLVSLRTLLKLNATDKAPGGATADDASELAAESTDAFIVVAQVGTYSFGIIVDRVFDTEEIVVKPVAPILRHIEMFSGNTILGDGSVIMILDPNGIASATGEISLADKAESEDQQRRQADTKDRVALLLFRAGGESPKAVPLALVARLEDIELDKVEATNGQYVVQYRGALMPLVPFDPTFDLASTIAGTGEDGTARKPVLVFADGDRSMGLIVDEIVDIVEQHMTVELSGDGDGVLGSAIIAGKATEVVDAGHFLTKAYPDWFGARREAHGEEVAHRILLVDDSPFFLNMLTPLLDVAGYRVTAVENAGEAIALRDAGEQFDIIVSDIEMPGMDGFEFAQAVKDGDRWSQTPIVALSSHTTPRDLDRGRQVGFTDYVAKFDREALLTTLSQTLTDARGAA